jgi:hypothetical protein
MRILGLILIGAAVAAAASVEGSVTSSATGRPIAGALVVLEGGTDSYVAQTDSAGRYQMKDVLAGSYTARSEREGFGAAARVAPRCTVAAEAVRVDLRMVPLGAISGRITDADGDPIPNAFVEALRYAYPQGKRELTPVRQIRADDRGEYRLAGLPPGRYFVRASLYFSSLDGSTGAMRIRGPKPALTFGPTVSQTEYTLAPGGELADTNLQLSPEERYTIRAIVSGPTGAQLMVSCWSTAPRPSLTGGFGVSGFSGRAAQFPNNVPGLYVCQASDQKRTMHARQTVEVIHSDVEVTLNVGPALTLAGAVLVDGAAGFARAQVRITLEAADAWNNMMAPVSSAGTFTMPLALPMAYRLRVALPAGGYVKSIYQGTRAMTVPRVDLSKSTEPLSITIGTEGATLDGVSVEGASVVLVPAGDLREWADLVRSVTAGEGGRFHLADIAPGSYQLFVFEDAEPGAALDAKFRAPFEKTAMTVTLKAGERKVLEGVTPAVNQNGPLLR